ncbi:iron ABC transporter permease [Leptolyngbya sp. 'hensonii']|uniref:FecCD family ABC transporter permease n=1 Tax=Leptolyngbya sp. 'hensonii' TaxID=1922337 RepID=UPI00094F88A3|nr:iron ABC transporter permease [Leptolyngbya sp. 'hensonii']OLP16979.1 iron ABC transporter permease [Leptolyngbya sp. 'hensonii']
MKESLAVRSLGVSPWGDRRLLTLLIGLAVFSVVAMLLNLQQGEYPIATLDILKTLFGINTGNPDHAFVIYTLRLPRTLVAFMVGVALAISGTIFQGLTGNPLADPSIIGINAGASLAAMTVIVLLPPAPTYLLPIAAFAGASLMAMLIYGLAWNGGSSPTRLILLGLGLSAIATAVTSFMITFGSIYDVSQALVWLAGSVYGRTWEQVFAFLPWIVLGVPVALSGSRQLNVLNLGDEVAKSLGSRVEWQRGLLVLVAVALAGSSVATAGTIAFVGLVAPHIGRQLTGPNHHRLLPVAALLGGLLVTLADLAGRTLFAPIELPCGVITATIGAPFFLSLLIYNRHR